MVTNRGGRPKKVIDWVEFDKLCAIGATQEEIANWFECDVRTIERALKKEKKMGFVEYFTQKSAKGKVSLRRKQMQIALAGNVTMLIWLGKQKLGQHEPKERWLINANIAQQKEGESIDEFAKRLQVFDTVIDEITEAKAAKPPIGNGS